MGWETGRSGDPVGVHIPTPPKKNSAGLRGVALAFITRAAACASWRKLAQACLRQRFCGSLKWGVLLLWSNFTGEVLGAPAHWALLLVLACPASRIETVHGSGDLSVLTPGHDATSSGEFH